MSTDRIWELMARKLAEEASAAELQELDKLLRVNPELHLSIQTIADLWQQQNPEQANTSDREGAYQKHVERMQQLGISMAQQEEHSAGDHTFLVERTGPPAWRRYLRYTAAATILVTAGWFLFSLFSRETPTWEPAGKENASVSEISTRNGSRTSIHLPDGSQVWLNAGSKLTYDKKYGTNLREVTLTGEAYFDVVKNPKVPFIIHTERIDVKVLGTTFNVKSYPGEKTTEASLLKGSIEVSFKNRPEKIILKPNEKIVVSGDSAGIPDNTTGHADKDAEALVAIKKLTYGENDSAVIETAWIENKLVFKDESFTELALKMERWYGVSILFTDPSVASLHFTGTFETESIQEALRALRITGAFNYRFKDNKTIIIAR